MQHLPSIVSTLHAFETFFHGRTFRIQMAHEVMNDLPIDTLICDALDTQAIFKYLSYDDMESRRFIAWLYEQNILTSPKNNLHPEELLQQCNYAMNRGLLFCAEITETQWEYLAKYHPYHEPDLEPKNIWQEKIVQIIAPDDWIKVEVKDTDGNLISNCEFEVKDLSGKVLKGRTGDNGIGKLAGLTKDSRCTVSFPQWKQAETSIASTHIVAKGETLWRIAQQYGFTESKSVYQHPANAAFRQQRPNPNLICPGDQINIPQAKPVSELKSLGRTHTFIQPDTEKETLELKLQSGALSCAGKRAVLTIGKQRIDTVVGEDSVLRMDLDPNTSAENGQLELYDHPDDEKPSYQSQLNIGHLEPIESLAGIQARCNALGFPCGVVDGIMGAKTREGIQQFQQAHDLSVDGEHNQALQDKLQDVYGC